MPKFVPEELCVSSIKTANMTYLFFDWHFSGLSAAKGGNARTEVTVQIIITVYVLEIIRVRKDLILMLCLFIVDVHLALSAPHFDNLKETSNRPEHD